MFRSITSSRPEQITQNGFVNRLQDSQFPSFLLFRLRGLNSYPGGTLTHCSCQPSLDTHLSVPIRPTPSKPTRPGQCVMALKPQSPAREATLVGIHRKPCPSA